MVMSDSPLTRADLETLHIPAGQVFGRIFKATRGMSRDEALVVAQQIHLGTWIAPEHKSIKVLDGSVWAWFVAHPLFADISKAEKRRMIEQGAIRLNWNNDWNPDDEMPNIITELTLFPSGDKRTLLWCITCGSSCPHHLEMTEDLERHRKKEEERKNRGVRGSTI